MEITNAEKRIVSGAVMIPDKKILRFNESGSYYIFFSKETIKELHTKFQNDNQKTSLVSNSDISLLHSWLTNEKCNAVEKYPAGTWLVSFKVLNDETWEKIKSGEVKGFSVEGFFEDEIKAKPNRARGKDHYCAKQVIDDNTGTIYETVTEAAAAHNMKRVSLSRQLNSHNASKTNLRFYYGA